MMIIMIEKIRQDLKIQKTALSKTMALIFLPQRKGAFLRWLYVKIYFSPSPLASP